MKKLKIKALIWIFVSGILFASDAVYIGCNDDFCTGFYDKVNSHGVVLRSDGKMYKYSRSRGFYPVQGVKVKKFTLYVGKSCDTYSKTYGRGYWEQNNGGFILYFKKDSFSFIHQELEVPGARGCY